MADKELLDELDMPGKKKSDEDREKAKKAYDSEQKNADWMQAADLGLSGIAKLAAGYAGKKSLDDPESFGQNIKNEVENTEA